MLSLSDMYKLSCSRNNDVFDRVHIAEKRFTQAKCYSHFYICYNTGLFSSSGCIDEIVDNEKYHQRFRCNVYLYYQVFTEC